MRMLANVQQQTIRPILEAVIAPGTTVTTDEYDIDCRLPDWGDEHRTVCHGKGEYARDEDGDGFHEVHVNTMEGVWSLPAKLAASSPGRFAGEFAAVSGLF